MKGPKRWLLLALLALWVLAAIKTTGLAAVTRKTLQRTIPQSIGMGETLREMVESLEGAIVQRAGYQVEIDRDPLDLKRVVKGTVAAAPRAQNEFDEGSNAMRLSCTVLSEGGSTAIVKYMGKSFVLAVGDTLGQRVVSLIDRKQVVMNYRGREVVLQNRPAPEAEIKSDAAAQGTKEIEDLEL